MTDSPSESKPRDPLKSLDPPPQAIKMTGAQIKNISLAGLFTKTLKIGLTYSPVPLFMGYPEGPEGLSLGGLWWGLPRVDQREFMLFYEQLIVDIWRSYMWILKRSLQYWSQ